MIWTIRTILAVVGIYCNTTIACADEQMVPLVVSGDWVTLAHRASMLARPDVCVVFNTTSGVALRAAAEGLQLRVTNSNWSLPTGVQGSITISVGEWKTTLEIDDNTDTMVNAEMPNLVALPLFSAMDKAGNMSVAVGKAKPFPVSLVGSTRATNAFRTCAGIESSAKTPGANPFE